MKFRPTRGSFYDAMSEVQEWNSTEELEHIVFDIVRDFDLLPRGTQIEVNLYAGYDPRNSWPETYLVILEGFGPIGFTDGPLPS